jgi:lytic cellulose monooxygenase (C1-hydroxylating)
MKLSIFLFAAAAARSVTAHATVMAAWLNDVDLGLGNSASGYIRSPPSNSPITDVTSSSMTCNVNGQYAVAKTIEVKAGDKVKRHPSDLMG